jgi:hypothetical protein
MLRRHLFPQFALLPLLASTADRWQMAVQALHWKGAPPTEISATHLIFFSSSLQSVQFRYRVLLGGLASQMPLPFLGFTTAGVAAAPRLVYPISLKSAQLSPRLGRSGYLLGSPWVELGVASQHPQLGPGRFDLTFGLCVPPASPPCLFIVDALTAPGLPRSGASDGWQRQGNVQIQSVPDRLPNPSRLQLRLETGAKA